VQIPSPIEVLKDTLLLEKELKLFIKRDDLIEPFVGGNKIRKMKYAFEHVVKNNIKYIVSCGGVYSNHLHALAYYAKYNHVKSIGLVRGEEVLTTATLEDAKNQGMELIYVTREDYKKLRTQPDEILKKYLTLTDFLYLPEGGSSNYAIKGCAEIVSEIKENVFDFICCPVGTGATIAGISSACSAQTQVLGFPAIKNSYYLDDEIKKLLANHTTAHLPHLFHNEVCMEGYGKINDTLVTFIKNFYQSHGILLDPMYNGKMMYYIYQLISKDYFQRGSNILCIHTGGTQGWRGFPDRMIIK
jgi:1-aminocyclopropane-1-carboxylate deaminase